MSMDAQKQELVDVLQPWGQEHVLRFWEELDAESRRRLARQVKGIDWAELNGWIESHVLQQPDVDIPAELEPAPYYPVAPSPGQETLYAQARERGAQLLRDGRVAGFTVAGGQGSRLGYDGPKGTFPIAPVSGKTLFQLFAERVMRASEKYGSAIPWYIMTSPTNDEDTRRFFRKHEYFGLDPHGIMFFSQGVLPAIGRDGKVLLAAKDSMALSPNGHGGSLLAMAQSGALNDMRDRGVDHISYWQVDNPLVQMFDPLFLGLHDITGSSMSSRSLTKTGPFEKLGNFCLTRGRLQIIEYSDMPEELCRERDEQGRLRFRAGSPAIHILRREFVEQLTDGGIKLPIHRADKKVSHLSPDGEEIVPDQPNAVKLEMFVFDALPMAENPLILEGRREEQFAPVKNRTGVDSVESCRDLMGRRDADWLEQAGVDVPRKADGAPDCTVELSARRFLDAEDVAQAELSELELNPGEEKVIE